MRLTQYVSFLSRSNLSFVLLADRCGFGGCLVVSGCVQARVCGMCLRRCATMAAEVLFYPRVVLTSLKCYHMLPFSVSTAKHGGNGYAFGLLSFQGLLGGVVRLRLCDVTGPKPPNLRCSHPTRRQTNIDTTSSLGKPHKYRYSWQWFVVSLSGVLGRLRWLCSRRFLSQVVYVSLTDGVVLLDRYPCARLHRRDDIPSLQCFITGQRQVVPRYSLQRHFKSPPSDR